MLFENIIKKTHRKKDVDTKRSYTTIYTNCKGVFQGGGAKAIAYVGAYEQALKMGVGFSEFAGTSAGSIVAAFAAAGASPGQMKDIVAHSDFSVLLHRKEKKLGWLKGTFFRLASLKFKLSQSLLQKIIIGWEEQGYYDSKPLYDIVDNGLRRILHKDYPIKFSDLPFPLTIVAADIKEHCLKVWSTKDDNTKNTVVAHAVRCSSCVPGVFKPVEDKYVDGGLLCNLPSIVFNETSYDFDRVLAFSFKPIKDGRKSKSIQYILDLIGTNIEGATKIQQNLGGKSSVIAISTNIGMLDFDKLKGRGETGLIKGAYVCGANAVKSFIESESEYSFAPVVYEKTFRNIDQVRSQVSYNSLTKSERIIIAKPNIKWVRHMFHYINKWRKDGSDIFVYVEYDSSPEYQPMTRLLLSLGVVVYQSLESLPFYGYFFMKDSLWTGVFINYNGSNFVISRNHSHPDDNFIIELALNSLQTVSSRLLIKPNNESANLSVIDNSVIINLLSQIDDLANAILRFEEVELDSVRLQKSNVLGYCYRAIDLMAEDYSNKDKLFEPACYHTTEGKESMVTPIVVAKYYNECVAITGNVRLLYAYRHGLKKLKVITIENYGFTLETDSLTNLSECFVTDRSVQNGVRYKTNFELRDKIEKAIRPYRTYLR